MSGAAHSLIITRAKTDRSGVMWTAYIWLLEDLLLTPTVLRFEEYLRRVKRILVSHILLRIDLGTKNLETRFFSYPPNQQGREYDHTLATSVIKCCLSTSQVTGDIFARATGIHIGSISLCLLNKYQSHRRPL